MIFGSPEVFLSLPKDSNLWIMLSLSGIAQQVVPDCYKETPYQVSPTHGICKLIANRWVWLEKAEQAES